MRFLRHDLHDYDMLNCLNMKIFVKTDGYEITDIFEIAINGAVRILFLLQKYDNKNFIFFKVNFKKELLVYIKIFICTFLQARG